MMPPDTRARAATLLWVAGAIATWALIIAALILL